MGDSVHPNDLNYDLFSLDNSPAMERYHSSAIPTGNNAFNDSLFPENTALDTIEPSSLHIHDDACANKCPGTYNPNMEGFQQNMATPSFNARPRFNPFFYQMADNGFHGQSQVFNDLFLDDVPNTGFRYGLNQTAGAPHHLSNTQLLLENNFNAADLGMSQYPAPEDCASVNCSNISCQSECCSEQVCQKETCSGDGTPCNNAHCLETPESINNMWNMDAGMNQQWSSPMGMSSHDQCGHTHTEHDVAQALRNLAAPDATNVPQQQVGPLQHNYPSHPVASISELPFHHRPQSSFSTTTDVDSVPPPLELEEPAEAARDVAPFTCQWKLTSPVANAQVQICGTVFNDSTSLHEHVCNDHAAQLTSKTKYVCAWDGCTRDGNQGFPSRNKLSRHIATHSQYKPYTCETCGDSFSAQQALDQHVRTHTGETPYLCDTCGKSFKQKSALTMHKRVHTGEKPLVCEVCGKAFGESSNLSKHRKTHNPNPKYECDVDGCSAKFIRIDQLRRHKTRHERPRKKRAQRAASSIPTTSSSPAAGLTPAASSSITMGLTPPSSSPETVQQELPQLPLFNNTNLLQGQAPPG